MISVSDSEIYSDVVATVRSKFEHVYNSSDDTFILAISRKGPRQLESIMQGSKEKDEKKNNISKLNVLTELALPYFFNSLRNHPPKPLTIYLYDDAVYFGTTMESVYKELQEYKKHYGLDISIICYTGVLTAEAKTDFLQIDAAKDGVRKGYGHYFIRRLTQDIRSLRLPFELEFPVFYYEVNGADFFNEDVKQRLICNLKNLYGDQKVYEVTYYKEQIYSITILLNSDDNLTSINKIRIYPSADGRLVVTCISPYIISNSKDVFQDAWSNTVFKDIWQSVYERSIPADGEISEEAERNRRKSLVSFYSYINSLRVYLNRKAGLIKALCDTFGSDKPAFRGFKSKDLFYLFGDAELSDKLAGKLHEIYSSYNDAMFSIRRVIPYPPYPVFEMTDFPTTEERQRLEFKNIDTIKHCSTVQQALSVLFFNQNSLIEKWSRRHTRYDQKRLRFGQTFESIFQNVKVLSGLSDNLTTIMVINRWVDRRIDQGSVVPQYVKSHSDDKWYRVFRPGENEEAVLSHLCRIVLLVFNEIMHVLERTEIENFALEYLLAIPFMRDIDIDDFSCYLQIPLQSQGGILSFKDDDTSQFIPLVNYLLQTGVLEENDKKISVSKTLGDEELSEVTTLDSIAEDNYRSHIVNILNDLNKVDSRLYYTVFNFYAFNPTNASLERHESNIDAFCAHCDDTLVKIERSLRHSFHISPMEIFNSLIGDYTTIRSLQMNEEFWLNHPERLSEMSEEERVRLRVQNIQQKLLQLRGIYELVIYSFAYTDYLALRQRFNLYLDVNEKRSLLFEDLRGTANTLLDENRFNSNVWDRSTVLSYRRFINTVIKYHS